MNTPLLSAVEVQLFWATRRRLTAGQRLFPAAMGDRKHPFYSLWYVVSGSVEVRLPERDECWTLTERHLLVLPTHEKREVRTLGGVELLSVGMRATLAGEVDLIQPLPLPGRRELDGDADHDLRACMETLVRDYGCLAGAQTEAPMIASPSRLTEMMFQEGLARALFGLLWRLYGGTDGLTRATMFGVPLWLERTLSAIQADPGVNVTTLARFAGLSLAQFRRLFHRWLGMAPHAYLELHRMREAQRLLRATALPVSEVAIRSGFDSVTHFNRVFKQSLGLSPTQYRRMQNNPSIGGEIS